MANRYTAAFPTVRASRQDQWRPIYRDRQSVPGPLVTLAQQAREAGEVSWLKGSALLVGLALLALFLTIAFTGAYHG